MPQFYFTLRGSGFEVPDLAGRHCADEAAARAEAERIAAELVEAAHVAGEAPPEAILEVGDEELRPVLALPIGGSGAGR
jgi:hypothetical protein